MHEIREFIEEEHGRMSVKLVSLRFTLPRTSSRKAIRCLRLRPLAIRAVHRLEDLHIQVRRRVAGEVGTWSWMAHLEADRNVSTA